VDLILFDFAAIISASVSEAALRGSGFVFEQKAKRHAIF
jgi:hypothetical protein